MKLVKQGKFYIVILEQYTKDSVYHCHIKKQKYWNNRKWRINKLRGVK